MADQFWVVNSFRTVQVLSATSVQDAEYATCQTIPNGLGFAYAVPYESWKAGDGGALLEVIAGQLENMAVANGGHVAASTATQDIDLNGLLTDTVDATVVYDRSAVGLPPLYGTVSIPVQAFFNQDTGIGGFHVGESPNQYVLDEYNRLAALAAA